MKRPVLEGNSLHCRIVGAGSYVCASACPPHQWAHAPTVGYFHCSKCGERVEHSDPRYAEMVASNANVRRLTPTEGSGS